MNYKQYLQSEHWKLFKAIKGTQTPRRCSICATYEGVELHHLFYRPDLHDVQTSDTRWLCRRCHQTAHDLINSGELVFKKPTNHQSVFSATKWAVKKHLGLFNKNCFVTNE